VTNLLATSNPAIPSYTFQRNADNSDFETTDGQPLRVDGSNAIPYILPQEKGAALLSIGFIFEF